MKTVAKGPWPKGKTISGSGEGGGTYLFAISEIWRYVYEMLRGRLTPDELKDVAQEISLWLTMHQREDPTFKEDPDQWHRAMVDKVKNDHRKERKHGERFRRLAEVEPNLLAELGSPTMGRQPTNPLQAVITNEELARVNAMINGLPARQQEVVRLRLAGLRFKAIGAALGTTTESAEQNMDRAKKKLRTQLTTMRGTYDAD